MTTRAAWFAMVVNNHLQARRPSRRFCLTFLNAKR
jgi:hypothetical protein